MPLKDTGFLTNDDPLCYNERNKGVCMFSDKNIRIAGFGVFIGILIYLSCTIGGAMLGHARAMKEHPQDYTADEFDRSQGLLPQPAIHPQTTRKHKRIEMI